jgi:hypothetical protein
MAVENSIEWRRCHGEFPMNMGFRWACGLTACALVLSACGGGEGAAKADHSSFSAPASVVGTISGLGSVVLNGVRYETLGALVLDADDGAPLSLGLGLGMTVGIDPSASSSTTAATIRVYTGLQGPATDINAAERSLSVAGLPVLTDSTTLVVTAAGWVGNFSQLAAGQSVDVHGVPQSDGTFKATRIEIEASAQPIRLVGVVSNLNTANASFTLGSAARSVTVSYAQASAPAALANGVVVAVRTASAQALAPYVASRLYLRAESVSALTSYSSLYRGTSGLPNETNELYGAVSNLLSDPSGCTLQVQGIPTRLVSAALCAALQNGDYVEVKGLYANGTLNAHRVEFKTPGEDRAINGYQDDENDNDGDALKYRRQRHQALAQGDDDSPSSYEITGTLGACTGTLCTLTSHGTTWQLDLSTARWSHARVSSGLVEVKGYMASATEFKVLKIEAKD